MVFLRYNVFDSYDLKDYIVRAIKDLNFKSFSQGSKRGFFNNWDKNKNLLVKSKKLVVVKLMLFLIPIFEHLDESLKEVQALIIAPTKELAMQIYKVAQHIASFSSESINIKLYVGGTDKEREIEKIKANMPQIVIGTPGKIHDLAIKEKCFKKIYKAKYFVVDEMDMTLDQGYMDELDQIAAIVKDSKMLFCSATIAVSLMPFCKKYLDSPVIIDLEK
ncbi:MAG: DEAD/DEAH box helicase [Clostridium sp.]|nr:MAG: DEAD/DEAH box helicase [Clostridium sp.]